MSTDILTRLLERYGEMMVLKEVCEVLKQSPYLVNKIPAEQLPRTCNGGRRHMTTHFLTQDVASYMVLSSRGFRQPQKSAKSDETLHLKVA